jgi:phosphoribosyl 1,2-cyclic phosphodiesterase
MHHDPVWQLKFYGTRGSTPICERGFHEYGGNTTCITIDMLRDKNPNRPIGIVDAGTGIRLLGKEITKNEAWGEKKIFLMLTHFHWDHIQGLPFFDPAYKEGQRITVFSPPHSIKKNRLRDIFEVQTQQEYFPVQLRKMGAEFDFITDSRKAGNNMKVKGVDFDYLLHRHPGGAYSYRFEAHGKKIVICTDLEHGEAIDMKIVQFAERADLLVHDAQYTDEELKERQGWGHSSYSQAMEVARLAQVKQLVFTHHDPDHDDEFLQAMEVKCQKEFANCKMAKDGMEVFV